MRFFSQKKEKANRELVEQILLERYNQYYRLAYRYVHHEADAFDIVQTGAYKAIRSCADLKEPRYAQTWIYRIMLNECFQYLERPRNFSYEEMQDRNGLEGKAAEDHYADLDLQNALDTLSEKDRCVVILKYFEDMKLTEIADILEENVNTVKSRLYRSLRKLQGLLLEEAEKGGTAHGA
ncbi:MAG: sigma-70 family RNA polymerase sigma factor [Lachnospiraceae bacterium]|nr:sigma-70 family RNA polymerase sigma factor [Lachnospiraceae bacterium]